MNVIDINGKLNTYLDEELSNILEEGQNRTEAELEELVDELTDKWLALPKNWLNNKTVDEYFAQFERPEQLAAMFIEYLVASYNAPDVLICKMIDRKEDVYPLLVFALKQFFDGGKDKENICINIITFFIEALTGHPLDLYLSKLKNTFEQSDLSELIVDCFKESSDEFVDKLLDAYYQTDEIYVKMCLIDIISYFPGDEQIVEMIGNRLLMDDDNMAFLANCLARQSSDLALDFLIRALNKPELSYYDYSAIKDAVEALGEEVDVDRAFDGDHDYEKLKERGE